MKHPFQRLPRHCPYCGRPKHGLAVTCVAHSDLPKLDPQLSDAVR